MVLRGVGLPALVHPIWVTAWLGWSLGILARGPWPVYSLDQDGTYSAMRSFSQHPSGRTPIALFHSWGAACLAAVLVVLWILPAAAKIKEKTASAPGTHIEVTATLADALKAVEEVASDPTVYGTYVYEHDKTLAGARLVDTSSAFGKDVSEGKTFYKVVNDVLAPRHFKDTEDSGSITVRYVVRAVNPGTVSIRVDAVFIESARRAVHPSEGAVESAEFGQVQQHLNRIQAREREALEEAKEESGVAAAAAEKGKQEATKTEAVTAAAPVPGPTRLSPQEVSSALSGSVAELEQRVNQLRHQVEARVKASGAALKSAPFHTATTIQAVPANAEVAIVILTPYWYGVQTTDGHTGWIQRSQLEALP